MAKIPFDIKYRPQIESGEYKVETRDGRRARIICWDAIGPSPIIGLFLTDDGGETTTQNRTDGRWCDDLNYESDYDLFIVTPEEELTEFEQEVSDIVEYCKEHGEHVAFDYAKRHAKTLLDLAKKELARQGEVITLDKLAPYDKGFQDGKAEALKNLPRWRIWGNGAAGNSDGIPIAIVKRGIGYKLVSSLGIQGEQYIMLSDLEKLPGFNVLEMYNTTCGTSTATLHGNTSATDGKEHNPSFTD